MKLKRLQVRVKTKQFSLKSIIKPKSQSIGVDVDVYKTLNIFSPGFN